MGVLHYLSKCVYFMSGYIGRFSRYDMGIYSKIMYLRFSKIFKKLNPTRSIVET